MTISDQQQWVPSAEEKAMMANMQQEVPANLGGLAGALGMQAMRCSKGCGGMVHLGECGAVDEKKRYVGEQIAKPDCFCLDGIHINWYMLGTLAIIVCDWLSPSWGVFQG